MEWQVILAIVLVIPVILIPVVFIWYINIGGIRVAVNEARRKRIFHNKKKVGDAITITREK